MEYQKLLDELSNPAKRALLNEGIDSFEKLAKLSQKELLSLHGIGPKSLPIIMEFLHALGLTMHT